MKALLMDVGNSRVKWGVLDGGEIRRTGHISQERIREQHLLRDSREWSGCIANAMCVLPVPRGVAGV